MQGSSPDESGLCNLPASKGERSCINHNVGAPWLTKNKAGRDEMLQVQGGNERIMTNLMQLKAGLLHGKMHPTACA